MSSMARSAAAASAAALLVLLLVVPAAHAFGVPNPKRKARDVVCTLSDNLPQCDSTCLDTAAATANDRCGLCAFCNPDEGANTEFDVQKCKQQATIYLKQAVLCDKADADVGASCRNDAQANTCLWADGVTTAELELGFEFNPTVCGLISDETCMSSCVVCNPASACFSLSLCKLYISSFVNFATLYEEQKCSCT